MENYTFIFFEGIAGSGKSTTSQNISSKISKDKVPHRLLREVDLDNPFVINEVPEEGEQYRDIATSNWSTFLKNKMPDSNIWLMDNAFLQYPINALVWIDYPREKIKDHIFMIFNKLSKYHLKMVYLHGDDVRTEVDRVLESRGPEWLDKNIQSFVKNPFGKRYIDNPTEGIHSFFLDVVEVYNSVINELPIDILKVNKSGLNWCQYEDEIMDFIRPDIKD